MYEHIKSRVKFNNSISDEFSCELGVRQGECLSPFLFAMYVNDLEDVFYLKGCGWFRYRYDQDIITAICG